MNAVLLHSRRIHQLYAKIREAGVIHHDVSWRHVLRLGPKLSLIDFERAIPRGQLSGRTWAAMCAQEMSRVDAMLMGHEGF